MKPTFGTRATAALFALFERAKLSGQPRALARENIGPDMVALLDELAAKARIERKPKSLTQRADEMEQIWLAELEADPAMVGVDVRKALAEAQFWCRNNSRICTRKFFVNWLMNPKHRPVANPGGPLGKPRTKGHAAPAGWLVRLNQQFEGSVYARGGTFEIDEETDYNFNKLPETVRTALR